LVIRAEPVGLYSARRRIRSLASEIKLSEDDTSDILLAVGEALSNAYRHGTPNLATGHIYVDWTYLDDTLTVGVRDEGPGFSLPCADLPRMCRVPGNGCGLSVMSRAVDDIDLEFDGGTRVVLTKRARSREGPSV
jgi:anti-sigma regulatory factor (Ser/Thr protein kinase)